MTDKEIDEIYNIIREYHNKYLADKGVRLPKLKDKTGYTKEALVLVRLAKNYPNTETVSKDELTTFIRYFYPKVPDVQQARHLSMQQGWNIVSGTRGDGNISGKTYKLIDLENVYPAFTKDRRVGIETDDFEEIKKEYCYRCANCGSEEGKEHIFRKGVRVQLQKGHMDPLKPLERGNIIPQCQICNRGDRNRWVYDKTGRVIEIANTQDGKRIVLTFLKKTSKKIREEIYKFLKKIIG